MNCPQTWVRLARLLVTTALLWASAAAAQVKTLGAWPGVLAGLSIEPDGQVALDTEDWSVRCAPAADRCKPARRQASGPVWSTVPGTQSRGGVWALAARSPDPRNGDWAVSLLYRPGGAGTPRRVWPLGQAGQPPDRRALAVSQGHALALMRRSDGSMQASVVPVDGAQRAGGARDPWTALLAATPVGGSPLVAGVLPAGVWIAGEVHEPGGRGSPWLVAAGQHDGMPLRWQWPADPVGAAATPHRSGVDAVVAQPGREGGLLILGRSWAPRVSTSDPPAAAPELWIASLNLRDPASWQRPATPLGQWPESGELVWLGWLVGAVQPTVCAETLLAGQRRLSCRGVTVQPLHGDVDGPASAASALGSGPIVPAPRGRYQAPIVSLAIDGARVQDVLANGQDQVLVVALRAGETVLMRWPETGR